MNTKHGWIVLIGLLLAMSASAVDNMTDPSKLIDGVARQILNELDAHRAEMRKDPNKIRKLVDEYMLPHFDTRYAAQVVLGTHWRSATEEQRNRFIEAFYQSMLQKYGVALLDFTPDRLTIDPYRGNPEDKTATVRTQVKRDNGARVPVNYSMRKTESGWKAFDVTIEGISYLKTFKTDFGAEINQKGLEAVIQRLEQSKSPPSAKKGTA